MKRITLAAVIFSVSLAAVSPALSQSEPNQIQRNRIATSASALKQGNLLFDSGKYGEAIKAYTIAVEQSGSNAQHIQARLARSRAYVLATVYGSPGYDNYDQAVGSAIADCIRVINLEPKNPAGYTCRGFAYSYLSQSEAAFADFNRAIELAPNDPNGYFERGYAYYKSNNPDRAIVDFSQVIKLKPQFADAYYFRGINYTYKKPVDALGANLDFSQAIKLDPTQVRYYDARGKLRNDSKDYQGTIADYTKVIQLAPSANVYSDRGFAFAALGKNDAAIADYNQAIRLVPKHLKAYYGRGLVRAKRGDKKGAMSDFRQAQLNYREMMGEGNFDKPEYQQILNAIKQLQGDGI
ncbi:MAG: tetratricopeptide repeat protein [Leptolyngbyaceae cyanobacterium CSU_1_3]|nr:tetratricopeptide repeat protein [Leptolyngbyaceae cyanobacterium CSU_1_3]